MHFRPLPLLTVLTLAALALLIGLGLWQVDRTQWKQARIEAFEAARSQAPVDLDELLCEIETPLGRPVIAPEPQGETVLRVYGRNREGAPGWRIFRPAAAPDCADAGLVLMETGFAPLDGEAQPFGQEAGLVYAMVLRSGAFTPDAEPEQNRFYAFDRDAMAAALQTEPGALYAEGWLAADDGQLPPVLAEVPPGRHIGYAVTWFGFALALIAVYLAFHAARGRLAFTRKKD